jgi:hypothetical protein
MNKTILYTVIAVILIAAGIWFWRSRQVTNAPTSDAGDSAASMNSDLNATVVQDADFQAIDGDTSAL